MTIATANLISYVLFFQNALLSKNVFKTCISASNGISLSSQDLHYTYHYEVQQNSTPRFPPEVFWTCFIQFFAFSSYFGSI